MLMVESYIYQIKVPKITGLKDVCPPLKLLAKDFYWGSVKF